MKVSQTNEQMEVPTKTLSRVRHYRLISFRPILTSLSLPNSAGFCMYTCVYVSMYVRMPACMFVCVCWSTENGKCEWPHFRKALSLSYLANTWYLLTLLQSMQLRYHQEGSAGLWKTHLEEKEKEKEKGRDSAESNSLHRAAATSQPWQLITRGRSQQTGCCRGSRARCVSNHLTCLSCICTFWCPRSTFQMVVNVKQYPIFIHTISPENSIFILIVLLITDGICSLHVFKFN